MEWLLLDTLPPNYKDGRELLLYVDWEPLTFIGYFGPGEKSDGLITEKGARYLVDDGLPAWRVKWDGSLVSHGFDEPTHWAPLPETPPK